MQQTHGSTTDIHMDILHHRIAAWTHFWSNPHLKVLTAGVILFGALVINLFHLFISPPPTFIPGSVFEIKEGETFSEISANLEERGYARSGFAVLLAGKLFAATGHSAIAGSYFFEDRVTAFGLVHRTMTGDFRIKPKKVTLFEGLNKYEIANILEKKLQNFDKEKFVLAAPEGYMFPDTYYFPPDADAPRVIEIMKSNFDDRIEQFPAEIVASGRTMDDIITMASIIETEAREFETRRTIAGILWRRLEENMPLQVDVSFRYINGKGTSELTLDDLDTDSPYNSYKYAGLPPTPISNPGLDSIKAVLRPVESEYYFFLSDDKGIMHYAETFTEHKKNKELYLY